VLNSLRRRTSDEGGFTLIELLVVVLIIGILSAIAIPAFLSQTSKANDSAAKTQVGTLQTTMETYASEHNGSFTGGTLAELEKIEPTLKDTSTATASETVIATGGEGYTVESTASGSKDVFKLKDEGGNIVRECSPSEKGGCKAGGTW
jgi:type IV pilus assembly protein PilA